MNLVGASGAWREATFRLARVVSGLLPGGWISAFGAGDGRIGAILVVNLDRQPRRWRRITRELRIDDEALPAAATFRNVSVWALPVDLPHSAVGANVALSID
jgi:hypothetical protein